MLEQGADSHHDRHVHAGDERGQRPVNQRFVDHQVDVVEVVAEDGHTDGDRDGSDRPAGNRVLKLGGGTERSQDGHRDQPPRKDQPLQLRPFGHLGAAITEHQRDDCRRTGQNNQRRTAPGEDQEDLSCQPPDPEGIRRA